jgi:ATP-dependent DNA helicase DinG
VEARIEQLEQGGRNAFRDHALPAAAVALKQGAGRLVRHETDAGVLVVADRRLMTQGYGKRLMRALPPMAVLAEEEAFETALDALREDKGFPSLLGP